jgi:16S rRNA processing protein RimM
MKTIGRITKTYGFEGAVVVRSESGITGEPEQGEPVFVVIDGIPVPFFVRDAFSPTHDTLIISFDDYNTPESVSHLRGCEVLASGEEETADDLKRLSGFTVTDINSGLTGTIDHIIQNPGQLIAVALINNEEVLIPLHPDLVISVDTDQKVVSMALPAGLISLND